MEQTTTISSLHESFPHISHLPHEILEKILSFLSPYDDLETAKFVSKRWNLIIKDIIQRHITTFHRSLRLQRINWHVHDHVTSSPTIAERYSHCSCYNDKSLYVFGGCTSTNTTFNDLWRFDLCTSQWVRPLAMGVYPSPKAWATLVSHRNRLVLFGGWSHPSPYPLHQAAKFFNEVHFYMPESKRWSCITTEYGPPPIAGHSASVWGDYMVVFGGCHTPGLGSNDVWLFDLVLLEWNLQSTAQPKPPPRYGQSQCLLGKHYLLVIGGCGGPNQIFSDVWLLDMRGDVWRWIPVVVDNYDLAPPQLWCHHACLIGEIVVVLSKPSKATTIRLHDEQIQRDILNDNLSRLQRQSNDLKERIQSRKSHNLRYSSDEADLSTHSSHSLVDTRHDSVFRDEYDMNLDDCGKCKHDNKIASAEDNSKSANNDDMKQDLCSKLTDEEQGASCSGQSDIKLSHIRHCDTEHVMDVEQNQSESHKTTSPSIRPNASRNRHKQLEMLQRYSEHIRQLSTSTQSRKSSTNKSKSIDKQTKTTDDSRDFQNNLSLHILDISDVIDNAQVSWLPLSYPLPTNGPQETIFYTLNEGRGELLIFGGMHRDLTSMSRGSELESHSISNTLYRIHSSLHD